MPKGLRLPKAERVIIAVKPDTLKVFKRFAEAGGISLARAIGGWCDETVAGVPVITRMVSQARGAPRVVMGDLLARAREHDAEFAASPAGQVEAQQAHDAARADSWERDQVAHDAHHDRADAARPAQPVGPRRSVVSSIRAAGTPRPVIRGEMKSPEKGKR